MGRGTEAVTPEVGPQAAAAEQLRGTDLKRFHRAQRRGLGLGGTREVTIVCDGVQDPVNVGAIFRIADAVRAHEVVLAGSSAVPGPGQRLLQATSRGKEAIVPWRHEPQAAQAILSLAAAGVPACAIEIAADAIPYTVAEYPPRLALVVGGEEYGITRRALAACPLRVFVPMLGRGRSLNVAVSLAVVAYRVILE
jgi:tRNA G18 (ribose-2'-O)-methylase SpoU